MSWDEKTLLKIYREFENDEAINVLKKEISQLNFKAGEMISEIAELKHSLQVARNPTEQEGRKRKKLWTKDELISTYEERLKAQRTKITRLEKELNEWRNKYFSEIAKHKQ